MAHCGTCEQAGAGHPSRDPVLLGDVLATASDAMAYADRRGRTIPDARTEGGTTCDACGAEAAWHCTIRGRWIRIEPGDWPITPIPPGKRWHMAGDGTALNLGRASPSDTCRISHFDVCPKSPAPGDSPTMPARWRRNAQRRPG
ncbi:DUF6083 domain-containing protein [Streptomyces scopuliridis]|uniref:DUF6083 domain-containing protein n=1 Tax=Streptomyces scopuliridis TaxID=452529 RepID=UPI002DD8D077|nr:DUF6083 domain-containing protein [Streptomyces scopuliridis]WSB34468.1 DUF6083 domain-containing protein [Streptomyces scopuliridis]